MLSLLLALACTKPADTSPAAAHETLDLAAQLATEGITTWPPDTIPLGWNESVWAYGVHRLHAASGDPQWHDYYQAWMEDELPEFTDDDPRAFGASDEMSPAILASVAMLEADNAHLEPITAAAHSYLDTAPRTAEGAIVHWGPDSTFGDTRQVWIDSMFMFGVFLLREHERTGQRAYLDRFLEQYDLFSQHCRDPSAQLYRHAYDDETGENIPTDEVFWARGNAWVLVAAAELMAAVGPDSADAAAVLPLFLAQAEAIADVQADDGLWRTVLNDPFDDPDNYTETAASGLIGYALALGVKSGALEGDRWLDVLARAAEGIDGRVERGGELVVEGTSFGTNPGDYDYYLSIVQLDDTNLGVGTTVMFLSELDGLELPGESP